MMRIWLCVAAIALCACKERIPKLKDACVAPAECAMTVMGDDCCPGCELAAGNVAAINARAAWCAKTYPNGVNSSCREEKCLPKALTPLCLDDRCVLRAL
jgi:hypothetical protein